MSARCQRRMAAWLGLRWALHPAPMGRGRVARTVLGAMITALVAALAWSMIAGSFSRTVRGIAHSPEPADSSTAVLDYDWVPAPYGGDVWTTVLVSARNASAPAPPGLPAFPKPGQAWVSPALARALAEDPAAARRLPGTVSGLIGEAGLESPDELFAVVGQAAPRASSHPTARWGTAWDPGDRQSVPADGLALIVFVLVGLPLLLLAVTVSRLSASARLRRAAALHLLGVPAGVLARAAAVESGVQAGLGAVLGLGAAAAVMPSLAGSGTLGMSWFPQDTPVWHAAPVIACLLAATVALAAAARSRRGLRTVLQTRRGYPDPPRAGRRLVPLVAGVGVMLGFIVARRLSGSVNLSSGPMAAVAVIGLLAATFGTVAALSPLLGVLAARAPGARRHIALQLALRRLGADASGTAQAAAAIVLLLVTGLVGLSVLTDIAAQNHPRTAGHTVTVSPSNPSDQAALQRILAIPAQARAYQYSPHQASDQTSDQAASGGTLPAGDIYVATCASTVAFVAAPGPTTSARALQTLRRECHDGQRLTIAPAHANANEGTGGRTPPTSGSVLEIPDLATLDLSAATTLITQDPARNPPQTPGGTVYALPGPGQEQRYITQVLAVDPAASVAYGDLTTAAGIYPATRRLTFTCLAAGLLIALLSYLLVTVDRRRERVREITCLRVIGSPRRVLLATELLQHILGLTTALALGSWVGWLAGLAYLAMAGTKAPFHNAGRVLLALATTALLLTATTIAITAKAATRHIDPEAIRQE